MKSETKKDSHYILCYTRKPKRDKIYSPKLAYSMHLAYSDNGSDFEALNHNSGVLFVKATENDNGSLNAKSLKNPYIFRLTDGTFGVLAVRIGADGAPDQESKGRVLLFVSSDLLQYEEVGLINLKGETYVDEVACQYDKEKDVYDIFWKNKEGNYYKNQINKLTELTGISEPEWTEKFSLEQVSQVSTEIKGIVPGNVIEVSAEVAERLVSKLTVPENVKIEVPTSPSVSSFEELNKIKVTAHYSDGTTSKKDVDWNTAGIDWEKPGTYQISGKVCQDFYPFPVAVNRADPCVDKWQGKYYFIATNDADGNNTLYIREADNIKGLIDAEEKLILDTETYDNIKGLLWAPEFHIINGDLYIFHGASTTGEFYYEECHIMKLKQDGDPTCGEDWLRPRRVVKKDGSYLCEAGKTISLDMTYFENKGKHFVVWSQRQFLPEDLGAWLYIAEIDPEKPWQLINDPVVLSKPEYGWANNHAFVDEGAYALFKDDKIFLTFASALIDATYVVGLLSTDQDADLMDPDSWNKANYPLLTSRCAPGEYGPGHNAYVRDEKGTIWNTYHARPGINGPRSSGIRRVHFDIDGFPRLDLTADKDLNQELAEVSMEIVIE